MRHQERIKGLDGLRAIAVALVVLNHKFPIGWRLLPGTYGVHLFFVLSGFLIISILAKRRQAISAGSASLKIELWRFYENRFYRIWPIYFLSIGIAVAIGIVGLAPPVGRGLLISAITFTTNILIAFRWHAYPDQLGPIWSVAVEEQFYLWAAPVFLIFAARRYISIYIVLIGMGVAFAAWVLWSGYPQRAIYVAPPANFALMALGGLAATSLKYRPWMSIAAPWLMLIYLMMIPIGHHYAQIPAISYATNWGSAPIVALLLLGVSGNDRTLFVKILELAPIRYVGRISYGIYIYHGFVDVSGLLSAYVANPNVLGVLDVAIAISVAGASWRFIEEPLLNLKNRRRQRAIEIAAVRDQLDVHAFDVPGRESGAGPSAHEFYPKTRAPESRPA